MIFQAKKIQYLTGNLADAHVVRVDSAVNDVIWTSPHLEMTEKKKRKKPTNRFML